MPGQISAVLDKYVVSGQYTYQVPSNGSPATVPLTFRVNRRYTTSTGQTQSETLKTYNIPAAALQTTGVLNKTPVVQTISYQFVNSKYVDNLYIAVTETRDSLTTTTEVPVLSNSQNIDEALPAINPVKFKDFDENIPAIKPVKPFDDVVLPQPPMIPLAISYGENNYQAPQYSNRIYLDLDAQSFVFNDYNPLIPIKPLFSEPSIVNYLPNSDFEISSSAGSQGFPQNWTTNAPGSVLTSDLQLGDITDTNRWHFKVLNTNFLNAMNFATFKSPAVPITNGLAYLSGSIYVRFKKAILNFENIRIRMGFLNSSNVQIYYQDTIVVPEETADWQLLQINVDGNSLSSEVTQAYLEIQIQNIENSAPVEGYFYLPQIENASLSSTRTLLDRIDDSITITLPASPYYFSLTTDGLFGFGRRGLFSTTTNGKNGIEFFLNYNTLVFKAYDALGGLIATLFSNPLPITETQATYGIFVDGTQVKMYLNQTLIFNQLLAYPLVTGATGYVGKLESANSNLNGRIYDFILTKGAPS